MGSLGKFAGPQRQQDRPVAGEVTAESLGRGVMLGAVLVLLDGHHELCPEQAVGTYQELHSGNELCERAVVVDPDDVPGHFGWIGTFYGMDLAATSTVTRELLGWVPVGPTLIEDIDTGGYSSRTPMAG